MCRSGWYECFLRGFCIHGCKACGDWKNLDQPNSVLIVFTIYVACYHKSEQRGRRTRKQTGVVVEGCFGEGRVPRLEMRAEGGGRIVSTAVGFAAIN